MSKMTDKGNNIAERLPNIWSCENRYGKCRSAFGCHCAEITNQHHTITTLRSEVERLTKGLDYEVREHSSTMDRRDEAEEVVGSMYQAVTGNIAEWSNIFHFHNAFSQVETTVDSLRTERDAAIARAEKAEAALARLVNVVSEMKVPQTKEDAALQVMVTIGPALEHARSVLASLTEEETE